jgi:hypothetical protein
MSFSPSLLQDHLAVVRMQVHVQASIGIMHMANLSSTGCVNGLACKEGEAFLLEARSSGNEQIWMLDCEVF